MAPSLFLPGPLIAEDDALSAVTTALLSHQLMNHLASPPGNIFRFFPKVVIVAQVVKH